MVKKIATFVLSAGVAFGAGALAILVMDPSWLAWALLLAAFVLAVFTAAAELFGLATLATYTGLFAGAAVLTGLMVFFDWALGHPEASQLTLRAFVSYLGLYGNLEAVTALAVPLTITFGAVIAGRLLVKLVDRLRR